MRIISSSGKSSRRRREICSGLHAVAQRRCCRCTRGPVCKMGKGSAHEHTGSAEDIRHSLRNGFNGLYRALPGDEFVLSPSSVDMDCLSPVGPTRLRRLSTSNGCQDHTVLPYATASVVRSEEQ